MPECDRFGEQTLIVVKSLPQRALLRVVPSPAEPDEATDDELLEGLVRGDAGLGGALCKRLMRVVDATLYRVLGQRDVDHDDLVQASFEQIVRTLHGGKFGHECSLTTWASAITCNVALHAIRRRRTERRMFDVTQAAEQLLQSAIAPADPESQVGSRKELARIRRILAQMPEKLAQAVLLGDMLGCSVPEIAAMTNASVSAAQARLLRGRKDFAARLAREQKRESKGRLP